MYFKFGMVLVVKEIYAKNKGKHFEWEIKLQFYDKRKISRIVNQSEKKLGTNKTGKTQSDSQMLRFDQCGKLRKFNLFHENICLRFHKFCLNRKNIQF